MPALNLVAQEEPKIRVELERTLDVLRKSDYNPERDYGSFLAGFCRGLYYYLEEGNLPLIYALKDSFRDKSGSPRLIADFCCGSGEGTLRIAEAFPSSEVFGFDVLSKFIIQALRLAEGNPRVHFKQADVYNFQYGNRFDVVTFHRACGGLADKVIQCGVNKKASVIAGRFCCYFSISDERSVSKSLLQNISLRISQGLHAFLKRNFVKNFISPQGDIDRDLLSEFAKTQLNLDDNELERVARASVDSTLGIRVIDYNRILKLIERGYKVDYDEGNQIIVARRKS